MQFDYLVVGAGISGSAAAYELATSGTVALLEAETAPGYHSTGRSAALYTRNYGPPTVQKINQASEGFFAAPPPGFCERPLLTPRGALTIAGPGEEQRLDALMNLSSPGHEIDWLASGQALALAPLLRREHVAAAAYERGVMDIDVACLHQGYLKGFKARGGQLFCHARVVGLEHNGRDWRVTTGSGTFQSRILINAAGAWAGQIGSMAGAANVGLVPKRRTAIVVDAPEGMDCGPMPSVDFIGTDAYFKPDAGRIMASPGDQTPVEPQDVQPDEWDVAVLVDWLEARTHIKVRRIAHSWAGLRSFVADEVPVVGFDPLAANFFWLAGQGGYGIMMAPALGQAASGLILHGELPPGLAAAGVAMSDLAAARCLK